MNKTLMSLLVAASLPLTALADPQIYGKASVALQNADENDASNVELVSNNSRIGVKGEQEISEGLSAIYQLEYQTFVDDGGSSRTFTQRNIFVGLKGVAGTVMAGKFDSPLKKAQGKVDLFNDLEGDIAFLLMGDNRPSNIVQYSSPKFGRNMQANVAFIASEDETVDNGVSASTVFQEGPVYLALALDSDVVPGADQIRLVGQYSFGDVQLGALYETIDTDLRDDDGFLVSALWKATDVWSLKAQWGDSDVKFEGSQSLSLGADYKLSDRAKLFGYYTQEESDLGCGDSACDSDYVGVGASLSF